MTTPASATWIAAVLASPVKQAGDWTGVLATAMTVIRSGAEVSRADALAALDALTGDEWLALDSALRRCTYGIEFKDPSDIALRIRQAGGGHEGAAAFLLVASCHRSGYTREAAVLAIARYGTTTGWAALLLRAEDWVAPIQEAAARGLQLQLQAGQSPGLARLFDLLLVPQRRQRFASIWESVIQPILRSPAFREARAAALESRSPAARRFAHALRLLADPDVAKATIDHALDDPVPTVASWGLEAAAVHLSGPENLQRLMSATRHPSPQIRAKALRAIAATQADGVREALRAALFDRSHAPRMAAAFELRQRFGESALPHWRAALDWGGFDAIPALALADSPEQVDAPRLRSLLGHPMAIVRRAALRGLGALAPADLGEVLEHALIDPSPKVVRCALRLFAKGTEALGEAALEQALAHQHGTSARGSLLLSSNQLSKWAGLWFLLRQRATASEADQPAIARALDRWLAHSNKRFAPLDPISAGQLLEQLGALRASTPDARWDTVSSIVREFAKP